LKRLSRAIRNQLGVNRAVSLIDAENRLLERAPQLLFRGPGRPRTRAGSKKLSSTSTTPSMCSFCDTWWREINLLKARKYLFTVFLFSFRSRAGFGGVDINAKAFDNFSGFVSTQLAVFKHFSSLSDVILMG
jgi:hypothetical protein